MNNDKPTRTNKTKESPLTDAQQIFSGKQLINERPPNMDYETYSFLRKTQSLILKNLFRHCPSRKLSGVMGHKEPLARTSKGIKRAVRQRRMG